MAVTNNDHNIESDDGHDDDDDGDGQDEPTMQGQIRDYSMPAR